VALYVLGPTAIPETRPSWTNTADRDRRTDCGTLGWCRDLTIEGEVMAQRMERIMAVNIIFLQPLIALVAGILILIMPRLLNYIVAIYLILVGLAGLLPQLSG